MSDEFEDEFEDEKLLHLSSRRRKEGEMEQLHASIAAMWVEMEALRRMAQMGPMLRHMDASREVNQLRKELDDLRAGPPVDLPIAKSLHDVTVAAVRRRVAGITKDSYIESTIQRALSQVVDTVIKKELGVDGSFARTDTLVGVSVGNRIRAQTQAMLDSGMLSDVLEKTLAIFRDEALKKFDSEWIAAAVADAIKEADVEIRGLIKDEINLLATNLAKQAVLDVVEPALREEIPAVDRLEALLNLGFDETKVGT